MSLKIPIIKLAHGLHLPLPSTATPNSAGVDLIAATDRVISLLPNERFLIPCGFEIFLPEGYEGQIRPRSGLALYHGITVLNAPGTIDADYRGEIKVLLINLGPMAFTIEYGMRIAQLVIAPVARIEWQEVDTFTEEIDNMRKKGNFGSTGLHKI